MNDRQDFVEDEDEGPAIDWSVIARRWKELLGAALLGAGIAIGITFLLPPKFRSTTIVLPPQQGQSAAGAALSSLNNLATLAGGGVKTPADQYASLLDTTTVRERIIARFNLLNVYGVDLHEKARKILEKRTHVTLGKKDGLLAIEVEDESATRAADMANAYVDELRRLTSTLAVTEAQQRRVFFESKLQDTKARLVTAQQALQDSGLSQGAVNTEPRAAAENYASLRAQLTAASVTLETMHSTLADTSPEVQRQQATVQALQREINKLEASSVEAQGQPDYIGKYREFKYQETLFDLMAKQYELARVDEAREGALIQVIDVAKPAERRSFPVRSYFAIVGFVLPPVLIALWLVLRRRRDEPGA